ncbi:MAG: hypothetical protein RLO17_15060 [Cyclobacteriaceae bacterium]
MKRSVLAITLMINIPLVFTFQGCGPDCGPINLMIRDFEAIPVKMIVANSGVVIWDPIEEQTPAPRFDSLIIVNYLLTKEVLVSERQSYAAYACDPLVHYLDEVEDIRILSDQDYDQDHPKGANLNSLCVFGANNNLPTLSTKDFIEQINQDGLGSYHFLMAFTEAPESSNSHNISIEVKLKSGEIHGHVIEDLVLSK